MMLAASALKAEQQLDESVGPRRGASGTAVELAKIQHLGDHVLYTFAVQGPGPGPDAAHSFSLRYSEARAKYFQLAAAGLVATTELSFPPRQACHRPPATGHARPPARRGA
jgi:hypothetical protein